MDNNDFQIIRNGSVIKFKILKMKFIRRVWLAIAVIIKANIVLRNSKFSINE